MVTRFNCREDSYNEYMFTEEGGEYVKSKDYDKLLDCVNRTIARLIAGRDVNYMCAENELCGISCAVDDSLGILTECAEEE